jgi:hypothetical protein
LWDIGRSSSLEDVDVWRRVSMGFGSGDTAGARAGSVIGDESRGEARSTFVKQTHRSADMSASDRPQIVRDCYSACASSDRGIVRQNLTNDLVSATAFVNEHKR